MECLIGSVLPALQVRMFGLSKLQKTASEKSGTGPTWVFFFDSSEQVTSNSPPSVKGAGSGQKSILKRVKCLKQWKATRNQKMFGSAAPSQ